jgi:hypothetical protein
MTPDEHKTYSTLMDVGHTLSKLILHEVSMYLPTTLSPEALAKVREAKEIIFAAQRDMEKSR